MKTILITGGAGFIGSHLAEKYLEKGYKVIIVDNLSSGGLKNITSIINNHNLHFYEIDICEKDKLDEIFKQHNPEIVNHHAAQKSVSYSVENPYYDMKVNVIGLLNLLECCKEFGIETFLYTSSGGALSKEILGEESSRESDYPQLVSPYAVSKFAGERYVKIYGDTYNFDYSIQRYANVYGPRQVADGECGVIPIFMDNILAGITSKLMTYEDMPRGCTRDYVYIDDVVEFNMLATKNPQNDVFNIGNGTELYILDIYYMIEKTFNIYPGVEICGPRLGDVKRSVLDISKARNIYNWEPKYTLEQGLKALYNYEINK